MEQAKLEIRAAFANRAAMYFHIFDEMRAQLGEARATDIMRRAIYARGVEHGKKYHDAVAAGDFASIGEMFVSGSACEGELFEPSVDEVREDGLVLRMTGCPLLQTWREMGASERDADLMCEIAAAVDEGTWEGAGLDFSFRERLGQPGATACVLDIRRRG